MDTDPYAEYGMSKTELLAMVETARVWQSRLNTHELARGNGKSQFASGWVNQTGGPYMPDRGAYGACEALMMRILTEMYGTYDRAERIKEFMLDCGDTLAYAIEYVREYDYDIATDPDN